jgi:hypothetical protein
MYIYTGMAYPQVDEKGGYIFRYETFYFPAWQKRTSIRPSNWTISLIVIRLHSLFFYRCKYVLGSLTTSWWLVHILQFVQSLKMKIKEKSNLLSKFTSSKYAKLLVQSTKLTIEKPGGEMTMFLEKLDIGQTVKLRGPFGHTSIIELL